MKATEMVKQLQKIIDKYGDLDLIYYVGGDTYDLHDESFIPKVGHFEDDASFVIEEVIEDEDKKNMPINAVIISDAW
jgi:hypothetical protein